MTSHIRLKGIPSFIGKAVRHTKAHGLGSTIARGFAKLVQKIPLMRRRGELVAELPSEASPPHFSPRIAFLTYRLKRGYGVDVVVAEQVEYFLGRGYEVLCVVLEHDDSYQARFNHYLRSSRLRVVTVRSVEEASQQVQDAHPFAAIACTPPLFSALPLLQRGILRVFYDYGEPPTELFPDKEARREVNEERRRCASVADVVIAISSFISASSNLQGPVVVDLGNDHLLRGRSNLAELAGTFAHRSALKNQFIVLNVTRYEEAERLYKGIDFYVAVRNAFMAAYPHLATRVTFLLAGRSYESDRRWATSQGLHAASNLDDDELLSVYLDSSFYLTTSQWEGYNLGLAQALALGLPAAASDRGAHRQFEIPVSNDPAELANLVASAVEKTPVPAPPSQWRERLSKSSVFPWVVSCRLLEEVLVSRATRPDSPTRMSDKVDLESLFRSLPRRSPAAAPEISFLILNRDRSDLLVPCIDSIERECQLPFEILIGDTGSTDSRVQAFYAGTRHAVRHLGFYHFSAGNNLLAAAARGRFLCLLNNDVELIRTDFLEATALLSEPTVGTLGALLLYPDFRIQHAGIRICPEAPYRGIPEHIDRFKPIDGYAGLMRPRDVVAVTGAFMMIATDRFRALGGLDVTFQEEGQDVDLCLKTFMRGLRNIVHPALIAFHREGATRTVREAPADRRLLVDRYGALIDEIYLWQAERGL